MSELDALRRRDFLRGMLALPLGQVLQGGLLLGGAENGAAEPAELIVRQKDPENLEMPIAALNNQITPTEQFFVRNHFAVPKLEAKAWRLKVEGAVEKTL